jgi:hypothetical protein
MKRIIGIFIIDFLSGGFVIGALHYFLTSTETQNIRNSENIGLIAGFLWAIVWLVLSRLKVFSGKNKNIQ